MRAKDIICERQELPLDQAASLINRDCRPFLRQSKGKIVYRGMVENGWFIKKQTRQERKPKDSTLQLHNFVNKVLNDLGFVANRSNSVFVTGHRDRTRMYGNTYVVFPIGPFSFTWNTMYTDLFATFEESFLRFNIDKESLYQEIRRNQDIQEDDKDILYRLILGNPALYADKFESIQDITNWDFVYKQLKKTFSNEDLPRAIDSGKEIYIHCKNYYAVDVAQFYKYVDQDLDFF